MKNSAKEHPLNELDTADNESPFPSSYDLELQKILFRLFILSLICAVWTVTWYL